MRQERRSVPTKLTLTRRQCKYTEIDDFISLENANLTNFKAPEPMEPGRGPMSRHAVLVHPQLSSTEVQVLHISYDSTFRPPLRTTD